MKKKTAQRQVELTRDPHDKDPHRSKQQMAVGGEREDKVKKDLAVAHFSAEKLRKHLAIEQVIDKWLKEKPSVNGA